MNQNGRFTWKASLGIQDSHRIIAETCIWHLGFVEFEQKNFHYGEEIIDFLQNYDFLDYSVHTGPRTSEHRL